MRRLQRRGRSDSKSDKNKKKAQQRVESLAPSEAGYIEEKNLGTKHNQVRFPPRNHTSTVSTIPICGKTPLTKRKTRQRTTINRCSRPGPER